MKILLSVMLSFWVLSSSAAFKDRYPPGILLNSKYNKVLSYFDKHPKFEQVMVEDNVLCYKNTKKDYMVCYEFDSSQDKRCTIAYLIIDHLRADELLSYHEFNGSWVYWHNNVWLYGDTTYEEPVLVTITYGEKVTFKYEFLYTETIRSN